MKNFFVFLIPFFVLIFILGFFVWQGIYLPKTFSTTEEKIFVVEKSQNVFEIAKNLEKENLIKSKIFFEIYVIFKKKAKLLQAGDYKLTAAMNVPEIAQKIISGDIIKTTITIPEGWNLKEIGWYFENEGIIGAEDFFELVGFPAVDYNKIIDLPKPKDFSLEYEFLKDKPKNIGLEGYLFPDTYELKKGDSLESIIRKMLDNFSRKMTAEIREKITEQGKTIFEIITIASLLEKEIKTKEDKEIVAGILWKRLKNNIPLQVDAAIGYLTGKKTTKITDGEIKIDSPYNTYKYRGLPQGPICSPGLQSVLAALYPKESEFWYYLSASETGETIFSKTLKDHNIAKEKYLK